MQGFKKFIYTTITLNIFILVLFLFMSFFAIQQVHAQELIQDKTEIVKAKVIDVLSEEKREVPASILRQ